MSDVRRDFQQPVRAWAPVFALRRKPAGLTLVELIVVVCIIALCAVLLLERLRFYQEAAEKAAMEYTVGAVKSALQLRAAAMLLKGQGRNIDSLVNVNPV